ncbi:MAG: hypothetical protein AB1921_01305 [Thermodesulfobacteriota bacterium]
MEASKVIPDNQKQAPGPSPDGDARAESQRPGIQEDILMGWVEKMAGTREFRGVLGSIFFGTFLHWAGDSTLKRMVALPAAEIVRKELNKSDWPSAMPNVSQALKDPGLLQFLTKAIPDLAKQANSMLDGVTAAFEKLEPDEQKKLAEELLKNLDMGKIGRFLNRVVASANTLSGLDPDFWADRLGPQFQELLDSLDFGGVRVLAERAGTDLPRLAGLFMDSLFARPAKLVISGSLLPVLVNVVLDLVLEIVRRVNTLAPDIVADVVLTLQREMNGRSVGALINQGAELIRKLHTGSALLGEPGKPALAQSLSNQMEAMIREIDGPLFLKARSFLIAGLDTLDKVTKDTLRRNNDHLMMHLSLGAARRNFAHRSTLRSLSMLADMPDDRLGPALTHAASTWNAHDVAEIVNIFCQLMNRAREHSPEAVGAIISEALSSLDEREVTKTLSWLYEEYGQEARPLARAVFPTLIMGICDWLSPEEDEHQEKVEQALHFVRNLLYP